jgi:hypothetical protein
MMAGGGMVRHRLVCGVAGVILLATVLTGCTSVRSSLGTSDSSCYLTLPVASQAVGGHGKFLGIHAYTPSQLKARSSRLYAELIAAHATTAHMCVAAYTGTFTADKVAKPLGKSSGRLATTVINASDRKVLATVLFHRLPRHFGHPHLG